MSANRSQNKVAGVSRDYGKFAVRGGAGRFALIAFAMMVPVYLEAPLLSPLFLSAHVVSLTFLVIGIGLAMAALQPSLGAIQSGLLGMAGFLSLALYLGQQPWAGLPAYGVIACLWAALVGAIGTWFMGKRSASFRFAIASVLIMAMGFMYGSRPPLLVFLALSLAVTAPGIYFAIRSRGKVSKASPVATQAGSASMAAVPSRTTPEAGMPAGERSQVEARRARHDFKAVLGMAELKEQLIEAALQVVQSWDPPAGHKGPDPLVDRLSGALESLKLGNPASTGAARIPDIDPDDVVLIPAGKGQKSRKNGLLFHGEPGNGKGFIAEALAGELGIPFMRFSKGDVQSKWVGQTTEQLLAVFEDARKRAPVVLFIDELDSLLRDRSKMANASGESRELVNTFLVSIERLRDARVIILGATNYLGDVDAAAIRDGRFDFKIEVPPPDLEARRALLYQIGSYCEAVCAISGETESLLLRLWEGYSAVKILGIVAETANLVAGRACDARGRVPLDADDFKLALARIQGKRGTRVPESAPALQDVFLTRETRQEIRDLLWRIRNPEKTFKSGGSLPTGVLFSGDPGNGKTLLAKTLAKETGWSFIATSGLALMHDAEGVRDLMREVREARPALVYIDEADNILASRATGRASPVLNELLAAMDGPEGRLPEVIFIGATNHPEAIDPAALRGGRFTEKFHFPRPTQDCIRDYLNSWQGRSVAVLKDNPERFIPVLEGQSYANISAILDSAVNRSISRGCAQGVCLEDVEAAKARICG